MEKIPNIFRRLPVQVWYFLAAPLFFMAFLLVYCPFDSRTFLDAGRGLYYFNVTILFSILFVTLAATRLTFHFIFRGRRLSVFGYIGWCLAELLIAAAFMALNLNVPDVPSVTEANSAPSFSTRSVPPPLTDSPMTWPMERFAGERHVSSTTPCFMRNAPLVSTAVGSTAVTAILLLPNVFA